MDLKNDPNRDPHHSKKRSRTIPTMLKNSQAWQAICNFFSPVTKAIKKMNDAIISHTAYQRGINYGIQITEMPNGKLPCRLMLRRFFYRKAFIFLVMLLMLYCADTGMDYFVDIVTVVIKAGSLVIDLSVMIVTTCWELISMSFAHLWELLVNTIKWICGPPYPEGFTLFVSPVPTIAEFAAEFFERIAQFFSGYAAMFRG